MIPTVVNLVLATVRATVILCLQGTLVSDLFVPSYYPNCEDWSYKRSQSRDLPMRVYKNQSACNLSRGTPKGIYVHYDMKTACGGLAVIQRRVIEDVGYKNDLGALNGICWIGNDNIHAFTAHDNNELRRELFLSDANKTNATYIIFNVGNENRGHLLTVGVNI
ncbi:hypothetical protein CHS0354_008399 [Potamilus streckersoni]|uniref:Fibrinogen C-terminal domain-containing protein n=1 Tax=Potamilus streckersoni TaxID=2493646 RepID=A0AAE0VH01_9BIVA|nr:hypothetical protein CHS0354_008399 [Potamilus streckersoni]